MNSLVVVDREHARISPSSFERVEACTASVQLSASAPATATGYDALAGTAAHAVLEHCLKEDLEIFELGDLRSIRVEGQDIEVDGEMLDAVQVCLDFVRSSDLLKGRRVLVEQTVHLDFAKYIGAPMYGHADVLAPELPVVVVDYKHGFNPVAGDAVQLGLYVLAAVLDVHGGMLNMIDGMAGTAVVVQPRAQGDPVKIHEWSYADLRDLRNRVINVLRRVKRADWTYGYGPHCRWCPAAGFCPKLAAVARDHALAMITPTPEMVASGAVSVATLEEWYDLIPVLDHWMRKTADTIQDYLVHGGTMRNAKLVRKRTLRRWIDDDAAASKLAALGADPWAPRKVVTPAEAERRVPKARRSELEPLVEKPVGDLTVAPVNDPKPGVEVGATLKAALQSSVAAGYLQSVHDRQAKGEKR